jgi:hypothetical protein
MNAYILYVLSCAKVDGVPIMHKQAWMQLGMPDGPNDKAHKVWVETQPDLRFTKVVNRIKKEY